MKEPSKFDLRWFGRLTFDVEIEQIGVALAVLEINGNATTDASA
jgi:hypothetical protein